MPDVGSPRDGRTELHPFISAARLVEGCPTGSEDALAALAAPPHYTPFPNPFVEGFLSKWRCSEERLPAGYHREPMAADISEGRTDPVYLAQNYHTKVPYRAIGHYIEHYTRPGDLVVDGFCGSGMVGVAANQLNRRAILVDLSPAATFIAHTYCHPVDLAEATLAFDELLHELERRCGWLYRGLGTPSSQPPTLGPQPLDYVIWSELFLCPRCSAEFPFAEGGFDFQRRRPRPDVCCPHCGVVHSPDDLVRSLDERGRTKEVPVRVAYVGRGRSREADPSPEFFDLQREIERSLIPHWYPDNLMMNRAGARDGWGDMWRRGYHAGMERVSDFYFKRSLWVLATAIHLAGSSPASRPVRQLMLQTLVNSSTSFTRMRRAYQGVLPLVLYIPKLRREVNVIRALANRFRALISCLGQLRTSHDVLISTQSSTSLSNLPDGCVDYVFTDPPFGDNIRYSEVNFLWEAWLRVFTNWEQEAIISSRQRKGVAEYRELMQRCFAEMHRVLKPGRWITVAFHNSDSMVWNAIQQALQEAGFEVAGVQQLDKQQVSFKQASANTVRRDLVISARRVDSTQHSAPSTQDSALSTPASAWEAVRQYLAGLPVPRERPGADCLAGPSDRSRTGLELFNRMVAAHLGRGLPVPMDAARFLAGLGSQFEERNGLYFLPEQAAEYDRLAASSDTKV